MEWKGIVLVPAAAGDSGGDLGAGDISPILAALFGNRTAACVLLFLQSYGEGHAMRIAETFGFGLNMTQRTELNKALGTQVVLFEPKDAIQLILKKLDLGSEGA